MSPKKAKQPIYFKFFAIGSIIFLLGLGTVIYVHLLLPESAEQEWLALAGLILSIPGGIMAFYCYIRMLIDRFKTFLSK